MVTENKYYLRVSLAALTGAALAAMDFELFLASLPGIASLFHIAEDQVTIMTDGAFAGSAAGAFVFGYLADKYGRKTIFMIMTVIYAVGSFFSAFAVSVATYIGARAFSGFGTGGDESMGFTMVAEESPPKKRTLMMMTVSFSFAVGTAAGAGLVLLFVDTHTYLPYVFLVGVLPALYVFYLRKSLRESKRFTDAQKAKKELEEGKKEVDTEFGIDKKEALKNTIHQMYSGKFRNTSILLTIFIIYAAGIVAADLVYFPFYLIDVKKFSFATTILYEFISYLLVILGSVYASLLGQKIGRKAVLYINLIASALLVVGMIFLTTTTGIFITYALFQVTLWSMWAAWPFYINETYPTRMRATASNFGYGFQWVGNIVVPSIISIALAMGISWNDILYGVVVIPLFLLTLVVLPWKKSSATAMLEENAI